MTGLIARRALLSALTSLASVVWSVLALEFIEQQESVEAGISLIVAFGCLYLSYRNLRRLTKVTFPKATAALSAALNVK